MTDRCWWGCKSPELVAQGAGVTSALRLQLTYLPSQAMRISAMLFILYIYFLFQSLGFDRCRKCTLFPIDGVGGQKFNRCYWPSISWDEDLFFCSS